MRSDPQVLIVGAGPAGLAAALELHRRGIRDIMVIDRDDAPGGLPRFCDHPGFGIGYALVPKSGPRFAEWLVRRVQPTGIRICCATTMISVAEGPLVTITGPETSYRTLRPRAVILATGIREACRGNLMLPGERPESGMLTTGQLQQMVARKIPFPPEMRSLVVIGSQHVSFSAILTARKAGLRVKALIEEGKVLRSWRLFQGLARLAGIKTRLSTRPVRINARENRLTSLEVESADKHEQISCDAVVFSAGWIPEVAALGCGPVKTDGPQGGVLTGPEGATSVTGVFAAGNMRRPLKASGAAAREGRKVGAAVAQYLHASGVL